MRSHDRDRGHRAKQANRDPGRVRGYQENHRSTSYTSHQDVDVEKVILRKDSLARYRDDMGLSEDTLAIRLMLPLDRVRGLLAGRSPITNELATHIEEMLSLPASWLDQSLPAPIGAGTPELDSSTNALQTCALTLTGDNDMNSSNEVPSARVTPRSVSRAEKQRIDELRRQNLSMLTSRRGTKLRLAQLAATSGSRISLMTSGRKPVSEPFAIRIEDGLSLPRRWLDVPHTVQEVPNSVWELLMGELSRGDKVEAILTAGAKHSGPQSKPRAAEPLESALDEHDNEVAVVERISPRETVSPQSAAIGGMTVTSPIFDKEEGKAGAIAEALAKTILRLSSTDRLSEIRAFQLLGMIIEDDAKR